MSTVKLNAQVSKETRERLRRVATAHQSSIQSVVGLCIRIGLRKLAYADAKIVSKHLKRDGRLK